MAMTTKIDTGHARVKEFLDLRRQFAFVSELLRQSTRLLSRGHLAGEQEPEHTLWDDLASTGRRREHLLAFWNRQTVKANALCGCGEDQRSDSDSVRTNENGPYLIWVEHGCLPEKCFERAHAANDVLNLDVTHNRRAVLFPLRRHRP